VVSVILQPEAITWGGKCYTPTGS